MPTPEWLDKFPLLGLMAQPSKDWPRALRTGLATALGVIIAASLSWPTSRAIQFFEDLENRTKSNVAEIRENRNDLNRLSRENRRIKDSQMEISDQLNKLNNSLTDLRSQVKVTNAILLRLERRQKRNGK